MSRRADTQLQRANRLPRAGSTNLRSIHADANGICHLCGSKVQLRDASRDHGIPQSQGGVDRKGNYLLAHVQCNSARSDLPLNLAYAAIRAYRAEHPVWDRFADAGKGGWAPLPTLNPSLCSQILSIAWREWRTSQSLPPYRLFEGSQ